MQSRSSNCFLRSAIGIFWLFGNAGRLDRFEEEAVLLGAVLSDARAVDRRVVHDRALGFTDSAADTEVEVDDRRLLGRRCSVRKLRFDHDELNCLGRSRTVLLADDARLP